MRFWVKLILGLCSLFAGVGQTACQSESSLAVIGQQESLPLAHSPAAAESQSDANTTVAAPAGTTNSVNQTGLAAVSLGSLPNLLNIAPAAQPAAGSLDPNNTLSKRPPDANEMLYGPASMPAAVDVYQGLNNSPLMALLAGLADRLPTTVQAGVRFVELNDDGSHLYLVRLFVPSPHDENNFLETFVPTDDNLMYSPDGARLGAQGNILWPALYEKAIVKLYDAQAVDSNAHGYEVLSTINTAAATGLLLGTNQVSFSQWFSSMPPFTNPSTGDEATLLDQTNSGQRLTFIVPTYTRGLSAQAGYDAAKNQTQLASGAVLRGVPNSYDLIYTFADTNELRLNAYLFYTILTTTADQVLIRSPHGRNPNYQPDDHGAFWMPRSDLVWVWAYRLNIEVPTGLRSTAAAPHLPPKP